MRNIVFFGMLIATAFTAGWFKIQRDGEHTLIEIDRAEIRHDATVAVERGRQILEHERLFDAAQYGEPQPSWPQQQNRPWDQANPSAQSPYNDGRYQSQPTQSIGYDYRQSQAYQAPSYQGRNYPTNPYPTNAYPAQPYQAPPYPAQPNAYPGQEAPYYQQPRY